MRGAARAKVSATAATATVASRDTRSSFASDASLAKSGSQRSLANSDEAADRYEDAVDTVAARMPARNRLRTPGGKIEVSSAGSAW